MEPEGSLIATFSDGLADLVDKYRESGITVGEVIGAMEIMKMALWYDQQQEAE
jgi:hypothetical protein